MGVDGAGEGDGAARESQVGTDAPGNTAKIYASSDPPRATCAPATLPGVAVPKFAEATSSTSDTWTRQHVTCSRDHVWVPSTSRATGQPHPESSRPQSAVCVCSTGTPRFNIHEGASVPTHQSVVATVQPAIQPEVRWSLSTETTLTTMTTGLPPSRLVTW